MRWDTGGGCLGIIIISILCVYAFVYIGHCLTDACPVFE